MEDEKLSPKTVIFIVLFIILGSIFIIFSTYKIKQNTYKSPINVLTFGYTRYDYENKKETIYNQYDIVEAHTNGDGMIFRKEFVITFEDGFVLKASFDDVVIIYERGKHIIKEKER